MTIRRSLNIPNTTSWVVVDLSKMGLGWDDILHVRVHVKTQYKLHQGDHTVVTPRGSPTAARTILKPTGELLPSSRRSPLCGQQQVLNLRDHRCGGVDLLGSRGPKLH